MSKLCFNKYFSFDSGCPCEDKKLESLREDYLWFSKPEYLNDPFDCNVKFIQDYNRELIKYCKEFKRYDIRNDPFIAKSEEILKNFGICCFSKVNDSGYMWKHYADNGRGICVEYDDSEFTRYFSDILMCSCEPLEVDYQDELIDLSGDIKWKETSDGIKYIKIAEIIRDNTRRLSDELFKKFLLQKYKKWSKEQEIRLIIASLSIQNMKDKESRVIKNNKGYQVPVKRSMIKGIIFGVNTSEKLRDKIINIFQNKVTYKEVRLEPVVHLETVGLDKL